MALSYVDTMLHLFERSKAVMILSYVATMPYFMK